MPAAVMTSLHDALPTLDRLNATIPPGLDIQQIARDWLARFVGAVKTNNVPAVLDTVHPDGWWRDLVALTWDLRTFHGAQNMELFLNDRLEDAQLSIGQITSASLAKPYEDLQWIVVQFDFETKIGTGHSVTFLVPSPAGEWSAFIICTDLDNLKGVQDNFGPHRDATMDRGDIWLEERQREQAFEDRDPEVLIIGAGQSGLALAARLNNMGVGTLIVDKHARVGDQWRKCYDSLRLHNFVWSNHSPYLKFPDSFPTHIPAKKLADWYEFYANALDLNVWTSSLVTKATQDTKTNEWIVTVKKGDDPERVLHVDHLVFASGWVGDPQMPNFLGKDEFQGEILHSTQYRSAKDHIGKKVIVVGACSSAHDIAADCAYRGIDVTMVQRSSTLMISVKGGMSRLLKPFYREGGPPLESSDRMLSAMPFLFSKLLGVRTMAIIADADRELHEGLRKVGYRANTGVDGAGSFFQSVNTGGGQYIDLGACQLIIDGKIKIKSGIAIDRYTTTGILFEDGSELQADVIVCASGYGDVRDPIRRIIGHEAGSKLTRIWGLNKEGELNGTFRELGVPNLWYLSGSLPFSRIYSKHTALQIKAKQLGLLDTQYSAPLEY